MGDQSWRDSEQEEDGGRSRQRGVRYGGAVKEAQEEKGLFTIYNKFPNMETDDCGRRDSGEFDFNVVEAEGQNIPFEGEEDSAGMLQNILVTDPVNKCGAILDVEGKQAGREDRSSEEIVGSKMPNDKILSNGAQQDLQDGEEIAKFRSGMHKSHKDVSVYVGQWNQIKEKMEWNLMEGNKEGFGHMLDVMAPGGEVRDAKTHELSKKARLGESQLKGTKNGRHVGYKKSAVKVGENRRCNAVGPADSSPMSSNGQPMAEVRENSERKRIRAVEDDIAFTSMILAETALQSHQSQ